MATTSILGDLVRNVGGNRVDVTTLVGPNGDPHVYSPTPGDARTLAAANVIFVNGLGLEGWMTRLVTAAGIKTSPVTVSKGITPRKTEDPREPEHMMIDPHAWQSVANAKTYVANIRDGLDAADPAGKPTYDANAAAYLGRLDALEQQIEAAIDKIPADRRKIIITHNSFGYFSDAYGIAFVAPEGVSTDAEPAAKDVAKIIALIRKQKIPAVFMENIADPRLMRANRARNRRGGRRQGLLRRAVRAGRAGVDLHRHDAPQRLRIQQGPHRQGRPLFIRSGNSGPKLRHLTARR